MSIHYQLEIEIDKPREQVVKLFDNPDNLKEWQPGFVSMKQLQGEPGSVGSKCELQYKMGNRNVTMIETLETRNLPHELHGTYEAKGVWNRVKNFFFEQGEDKTLWKSEIEFKGKGFMWLMMKLMPGSFKKQSYKYMKLFKAFAEKQ